jgi:hypothetical protein
MHIYIEILDLSYKLNILETSLTVTFTEDGTHQHAWLANTLSRGGRPHA